MLRLEKIRTCNPKSQIPRLRQAIESSLAAKCAKKSDSIERLYREAKANWLALKKVDSQVAADHAVIFQMDLEKVWRDLKMAEAGCKDQAIL